MGHIEKYISSNLTEVTRQLYEEAANAAVYDGTIGNWFRITVGVRQRYLLSPTLFNVSIARITLGTLEQHEATVSFGRRIITNLRFADNIDGLAGTKAELKPLVKTPRQYLEDIWYADKYRENQNHGQ